MSNELINESNKYGQSCFHLVTLSTNSYSRTPSSLLTSTHRHQTSHHRGYVNNHETSLILANAGMTSATALNATILSSTNSHYNSAPGEILSNTRQTIEDLEAKRLERRRLNKISHD